MLVLNSSDCALVYGGDGTQTGGNTVAPTSTTSGNTTTLTCPQGTVPVVMTDETSREVTITCAVPVRTTSL